MGKQTARSLYAPPPQPSPILWGRELFPAPMALYSALLRNVGREH